MKNNRPLSAGDRVEVVNRQAAQVLRNGGNDIVGRIQRIKNPLTEEVDRNRVFVVQFSGGVKKAFASSELKRV